MHPSDKVPAKSLAPSCLPAPTPNMQRASVFAGIVALAALVPRLAAQGTNATCLTGFEWMTNSRGQSPCLVAAYLNTPCIDDPADAFVFALPDGFHYRTPVPATATACQCSSVFYSTLQACAVCQGDPSVPWSTWNMNCTAAIYEQVYPHDIPTGTSVPAWAYLDVTHADNFNSTAAKALADQNPPESTAPGGASATASGTATGSSPSSSSSAAPKSGGGSNAGAIAGGVVGGVVGLALLAGVAFWFFRKRNAKNRFAPSSQFEQPVTPFTDEKPTGYASPPPHQQPLISPTYAPQPVSTPPPATSRVYDPNDPTTFPSASPDTSLSPTAYTGNLQPTQYPYPQAPQSNWVPTPGRYSGAPEL
ncbi:hypothetical protein QCA50_005995 [Cerrena zonata]|uniref:Transmembrane protein n=1 Tax=Cerrena zonata TaxID=2478898 RepID=A0AAW0GBG8_9APHY